MERRVEFHLHTKMSRLDSVIEPEEVFKACHRKGLKSFAVTDHAVINAFPEISRLSEEYNFPVVYGIESFMVRDMDQVRKIVEESPDYSKKQLHYKHVIIIAKNTEGMRELNRIVSMSHVEYFYKVPILPAELLFSIRKNGNILIGSACESGEITSAVLNDEKQEAVYAIAENYDFLEIQPVSNSFFMIETGRIPDLDTIREVNRKIYRMSQDLGLPCIATSDAHMVDREDNQIRHVILHELGYWDYYKAAPLPVLSTEEMLAEFAYLGQKECREVVIDNSLALFDQVGYKEVIAPVKMTDALSRRFLESLDDPVRFVMDLSIGKSGALKFLKDFEYFNRPARAVFASRFETFDYLTSKKMVESYFSDLNMEADSDTIDSLTFSVSKLIIANRIDPEGRITILEDFSSTSDFPVQYPDDKVNPDLVIAHFNGTKSA